ncbi:MAG TPA: HD domain-containing protein, partial [Kofleriaceae bacterium]|nr:HD domain-containing protein [Kofleriaceae bacterium]
MHQLDQILSEVAGYYPNADLALIRRAYQFAAAAHDGQTRKSGDPYVTHPLAVAQVIAELKLDVASVCAGLLHDCVEDTSATIEQLGEQFGKEVAFLVDGVTKLGKLPYSTREEQQAENFRKMLLAMARDIRVILVKLCDRLDNMRSLNHLPPEKQERIAAETMQIYAPLANRLGIQWIKVELEDLAFKYLYAGEYEQLASDVAKRLDIIAEETERDWEGGLTSEGGLRLERMVRGVKEVVILDMALIGSQDARHIDQISSRLKEIYDVPPKLSRRDG